MTKTSTRFDYTCELACNERTVFPVMKQLIEEDHMGLREAARFIAEDSGGLVTVNRALGVWQRRTQPKRPKDPEVCRATHPTSDQESPSSEPSNPERSEDMAAVVARLERNEAEREKRLWGSAGNGCAKKQAKPTFNETNDNIGWAASSWNPVTGCLHDCPYCYACDLANLHYPEKIGFNPHFYPERFTMPENTKVKSRANNRVFCVSMGDLFGEWVPRDWIDKVMAAIATSPQWTYLVLTKNPARYLEVSDSFPPNLWVGATADTQARADASLDVFSALRDQGITNTLFLSCEPLEEAITLKSATYDWLIIGARSKSTGMPAAQPQPQWVFDLHYQATREHGRPVFWKENLERPQEFPVEK